MPQGPRREAHREVVREPWDREFESCLAEAMAYDGVLPETVVFFVEG
jgi:hypothetical protein